MRVVDLYSHRKRVAEGDVPDVFVYDALPRPLLVQIVHIWRDAIGPFYPSRRPTMSHVPCNNAGWEFVHDVVAREHGEFDLAREHDIEKRCKKCLLETSSLDVVLDLIEASFRYINVVARKFDRRVRDRCGIAITADDAITELNERFRRAGVGYRFEAGKLIRVDSELLHSEVVQPALGFLHQKGFEGPRAEFLKAHDHYRAGETKAAITEANPTSATRGRNACNALISRPHEPKVGTTRPRAERGVRRRCAEAVGPADSA